MTKVIIRPGVRITWHGDDIARGLGEATRDTVYEVGKHAEKLAKDLAHTELGNMRRATGMVHPMNRDVYDRRGRWPPRTVSGTREDVRKVGNRYTTHLTSLVNYAFIEEVIRGHRFIAPAALEASRDFEDFARKSIRKRGLS